MAEKVGVATLEATAKEGNEKDSKAIEIAIRTPNPRVTDVTDLVVQSGETLSSSVILEGLNGTNNCAIEVSALPPLNLHSRIDQLLQYPHGCVEQTTSSVFAQLFLNDVITLTESQLFEADENIQAGHSSSSIVPEQYGWIGILARC